MLFDRILGNISSPDLAISGTDTVDIEWHECNARALRKNTTVGRSIGILIPIGTTLHDGDVLCTPEDSADKIVVHIPPTDVWAIWPAGAGAMAHVALELGNLHVPVEVGEDVLFTIPDGPTREVLDRYGVKYELVSRTFSPLRATVLQGVKLADDFAIKSKSSTI
jgi:urease accessory protein